MTRTLDGGGSGLPLLVGLECLIEPVAEPFGDAREQSEREVEDDGEHDGGDDGHDEGPRHTSILQGVRNASKR